MHQYKMFLKLVKANLTSILVYFGVYLVLLIAMSNSGKSTLDEAFASKQLSVYVVDEDQTQASEALISYLSELHHVTKTENDKSKLSELLYYREAKYVLTIPEGYEQKLSDGETKNLLKNACVSDSAAGYFVGEQIDQYLTGMHLYLLAGESVPDASKKTLANLKDSKNTSNLEAEGQEETGNEMVFYLFRYLPYVLIAILVCGLSPVLVRFNETDLKNRIACSKTPSASRNLSLALGSLTFSLVVFLAFWLVGLALYKDQMFTDMALLGAVNGIVFLLFCAGLAFLVSCFGADSNAVNLIANIVGLSMSFTCGVFVPMDMLSDQVLAFARLLPAYWFTRCNNMLGGLSKESFDAASYLTYLGIEFGFVCLMFGLAMVVRRYRKVR